MSSEYHSVPEGLVLCSTLIGWNYLLDWLAFRFESLRPWLEPPPLPVVSNGRINRRNLRLELISVDELRNQLRKHGIEDIGVVKKAYLESDGQLSVVMNDRKHKSSDQPPKSGHAGTP